MNGVLLKRTLATLGTLAAAAIVGALLLLVMAVAAVCFVIVSAAALVGVWCDRAFDWLWEWVMEEPVT